MSPIETFLGLLLVSLSIALLAKRLDQPYPIALVLAGLALTFIPGAPQVELNPDLVFFLLLPPILSEAAFFTSWRDFWRLRRPILLLAFGLVAFTSSVIAALCVLFIPGMTWSTGFLLGAIISPPDAAAATSITRGLGLPKRVMQILEGESLVNDASALTLYRFAIIAVSTGSFSWGAAFTSFLWIAVGGTAIGLVLGWLYVKGFRWIRDPEIEILSTFLLSYLSYFLAEQVHSSGVLAAVASGLMLGWHSPTLFNANTRIRGFAVWRTFIFFINSTIFLLIGLQIPLVMQGLGGYPLDALLGWAGIIILGVILTRLAWVFPAAWLPRWLSPRIRQNEPNPGWRNVLIVGWTGLRGVVSLAAALALPLETERGLPFPYRNLLLFLSFAAILGTLVFQGLTLRPLIRLLRPPVDKSSEEEELHARIHTTEAVLTHLAEMHERGQCSGAALDRIRGYYGDRLTELKARLEHTAGSSDTAPSPDTFQSLAEQRIWWQLAQLERSLVVDLRRQRHIGDEALHALERDIDLLEARITPAGH